MRTSINPQSLKYEIIWLLWSSCQGNGTRMAPFPVLCLHGKCNVCVCLYVWVCVCVWEHDNLCNYLQYLYCTSLAKKVCLLQDMIHYTQYCFMFTLHVQDDKLCISIFSNLIFDFKILFVKKLYTLYR